jgi:hypothetical protein
MDVMERDRYITALEETPDQLEALVAGLGIQDLTVPYLAGEWSVAQNVHHLADSHAIAYVRSLMIATQDQPALPGYDVDTWAALPAAMGADLAGSLALFRGVQSRWAAFFRTLPIADLDREGIGARGAISLGRMLQIYSGHGLAHIDQIQRTLAAKPA